MDERKVIYYDDELNEEFSKTIIKPRVIDKDYVYVNDSFFERVKKFICYRLIATPIAFFYTKFKFSHKVINKKILKPYKKKGYFMYGNHTQDLGDAFIFNMINFPKTNYVIVHPNNVSIKGLGNTTHYLGAIPQPSDLKASKNFLKCIDYRISQGNCVVIYPEAHIWPYYTHIRNFTDTSFSFPIKDNVPTFAFTNTYVKRKHRKEPKIITYVDGPFYGNGETIKEKRKDLRDKVYNAMCERSKNSNIEVIKYIKRSEAKND